MRFGVIADSMEGDRVEFIRCEMNTHARSQDDKSKREESWADVTTCTAPEEGGKE